VDDEAQRVTRHGRTISLSPTEYTLLRYLMINAGRVVSRAQILDHVWQYDFDGDSSVVDTFISYLRRKVDTDEGKLIHTIRGIGYCLRDDTTP
jgi:two-component system, OmpR family, response regulator